MSQKPVPAEKCASHLRNIVAYSVAYLFFLGTLLLAHAVRITKDPAPIGEELASGYRNAVYFDHHLQSDGFATTYSSHLFFWVGSKLLPVTINSARIFKMLLTALLAPIVLALMLRLLPGISPGAAWFPVLLLPLLPTISWYGIMGFEYIIDLMFSFGALLAALSFNWRPRSLIFWIKLCAFCALIGFTLHLYSASLPVLLVSVGVMLWRLWITQTGYRHWLTSALLSLLFVGLLTLSGAWPYFYYRDEYLPILRGGGQLLLTKEALSENLHLNYLDLFTRSSSYLMGGYLDYPCFPFFRGGILILSLMFIGAFSARRSPEILWLVLIGGMSLAITLLIGVTPGIRRAMPLLVVVCMLAGLALDWLSTRKSPRMRVVLTALCTAIGVVSCWDFYPSVPWWAFLIAGTLFLILSLLPWARHETFGRALAPCLGLLFLFAPLATYLGTYAGIADHYESWLQRQFKYLPGMGYAETMEELVRQLQEKQIELSSDEYHHDTFVFLDLICKRRHLHCIPPKFIGSGWMDSRITLFAE